MRIISLAKERIPLNEKPQGKPVDDALLANGLGAFLDVFVNYASGKEGNTLSKWIIAVHQDPKFAAIAPKLEQFHKLMGEIYQGVVEVAKQDNETGRKVAAIISKLKKSASENDPTEWEFDGMYSCLQIAQKIGEKVGDPDNKLHFQVTGDDLGGKIVLYDAGEGGVVTIRIMQTSRILGENIERNTKKSPMVVVPKGMPIDALSVTAEAHDRKGRVPDQKSREAFGDKVHTCDDVSMWILSVWNGLMQPIWEYERQKRKEQMINKQTR